MEQLWTWGFWLGWLKIFSAAFAAFLVGVWVCGKIRVVVNVMVLTRDTTLKFVALKMPSFFWKFLTTKSDRRDGDSEP